MTFFDENTLSPSPGGMMTTTSAQNAEGFHQVIMVRRREGQVRFPAWERPAELVHDIREFARLLTRGPVFTSGVAAPGSMYSPAGPGMGGASLG